MLNPTRKISAFVFFVVAALALSACAMEEPASSEPTEGEDAEPEEIGTTEDELSLGCNTSRADNFCTYSRYMRSCGAGQRAGRCFGTGCCCPTSRQCRSGSFPMCCPAGKRCVADGRCG